MRKKILSFDVYPNISSRIVEVCFRNRFILKMFVLIEAIIGRDRFGNSKNVTQLLITIIIFLNIYFNCVIYSNHSCGKGFFLTLIHTPLRLMVFGLSILIFRTNSIPIYECYIG